MKKLNYIFTAALVVALSSCGGEKTEKADGDDTMKKQTTEQVTPAPENNAPAPQNKESGTSVNVSQDGAAVQSGGTKVEVSKDKASVQIKK